MIPEFDELAGQAFSHITDLMGEGAAWHSSSGTETVGRVLFKNPTEPVNIGDSETYEYRPNDVTVEYYEGTFPGLRETVDQGTTEYLRVRGKMHLIDSITTRHDGKTYVAHLTPHEE